MNPTVTIAKKELKTFFLSPLAYLVLVVTVAIFNAFFFMIIDENREASLRDIFKVMEFMFVFIVPLLTMKLLSEEKAAGTMEFLMTNPISNTAIVLGKYVGALIFFSTLIAITLLYYFIVEHFGSPDRWAVLSGYLGIWLEGAFFIAIGLWTSSLTRSQIIAAITSYLFIFALYFSVSLVKYLNGPLAGFVRYFGTWSHAENFAVGLITSADIIYYLSGIVLFLILTRLNIENRLWN